MAKQACSARLMCVCFGKLVNVDRLPHSTHMSCGSLDTKELLRAQFGANTFQTCFETTVLSS